MQTHLGFPLDILPAKAYNTDVSKREGEIMTEHEQHDRSDRNGERDRRLEEDLILAWLRATSVLKNTRITRKMIYNEAVVMAIVYERYREDGVGAVSLRRDLPPHEDAQIARQPHDRLPHRTRVFGAQDGGGQADDPM